MKIVNRLSQTLVGGALLMMVGPAFATVGASTSSSIEPREWNFQVYLNDDPIGFHNFRLQPQDDGYQLQTEAEFKVKFLFVTAYRYEHENVETWRNGCLERIESETNDNGDRYRIVGTRDEKGFDLAGSSAQSSLDAGCVRSFAYWDLDKLRDTRLLNPQTGEYLPIDIERVGRESIEVDGRSVDAERYSLNAEGLDLDLWYTPEGEWLKLTSNVEEGRQLRYELVRS
jgi:hypothetical protein